MNQNKEMRKVKDTIHTFIYFSHNIWKIIDTPHFQRLRHIKQLGYLQRVFPTATHTSFEHSLGVGHLAKTYIEFLIKNHPHLYQGQNIDLVTLSVTLAGLLRNINYQPFIHIDDKYSNEPTAQMIIDAIYKEEFKIFVGGRKQDADELAYRVKLLISGQKITDKAEEILNFESKDKAFQDISNQNRYLIAFFLTLSKEQRIIVESGLEKEKQEEKLEKEKLKEDKLRENKRCSQDHDFLVSKDRKKLIQNMKLSKKGSKLLQAFIEFLDKQITAIFNLEFQQDKYKFIRKMYETKKKELIYDQIEGSRSKDIKKEDFIKKSQALGNPQIFDLLIKGVKQNKELSEYEQAEPRKILRMLRQLERPWELDLINNKKHGIDVNIFESIRRDAFNLGHKIDVEYELLMNEACILGAEICYPTKYVDTVYNIFQSRYKLNKNYYNNVFSVSFEQMIQQVFKLIKVIMATNFCDSKFKQEKGKQQQNFRQEKSMRLQNFLKFTDTILDRIEDIMEYNGVEQILKKVHKYQELDYQKKLEIDEKIIQEKKKLLKACKLIDRIKNRKFYLHMKEMISTFKVRESQLEYNNKLQSLIKNQQIKQQQLAYRDRLSKQLEKLLPSNENEAKQFRDKETISKKIISNYIKEGSLKQLTPQDIKIAIHDIGYGIQNKNPLQSVGFFQKHQQVLKRANIPNTKLSMLYTEAYNELSIKVYYIESVVDQDTQKRLINAIEAYMNSKQSLYPGLTKSVSRNMEQNQQGSRQSVSDIQVVP